MARTFMCFHRVGAVDLLAAGFSGTAAGQIGLALNYASRPRTRHITSPQGFLAGRMEFASTSSWLGVTARGLQSVIGRSSTEPELNNAARMCPHA
jgi:hypothetical protein